MSAAPHALDVLTFPFRGAQVIEASAGTGKTWTVTSLYLRLVLGEGPTGAALRPPDILVMTFTEAATQELRDRIRRRLAEAAAYFRGQPLKRPDVALIALRDRYAGEGLAGALRLLEAAGQWMDEAAIHTIHGWSSRMLRQHAFDSGSLFEQQRVEDPAALLHDATREYWRQAFYAADPFELRSLRALPKTPDALLEKLRPILARLERDPQAEASLAPESPAGVFARAGDWSRRCLAAERQARECWRANLHAIEDALREAMATQLNGNVYKIANRESYLQRMRAWCEGESLTQDELKRFSASKLKASLKKGCTAPPDTTGAYAALDAVLDCGEEPDLAPLYEHAALDIRARLDARKQRLGQFDFSDLLQRLYHALHAPDGRLARAIRRQYPVALVDEFQDTDRWQYGALSRIYLDPHPEPAALVMIGDPKQAIYRFRGADLPTYLDARDAADDVHTLTGNYRSTPGLVAAVNHVFRSAMAPFGRIAYEDVVARKPEVLPLQGRDGVALPAMQLWTPRDTTPQAAEALRVELSEGFATQMVAMLDAGLAAPSEMAVLVRNGREARRIRQALAARGVRSVYLSDRDSVYATDQARDLWYLLRAVAAPRSAGAIRAALSTHSFGYEVEELDRLLADEAAFEAQAEHFARWQQTWQQQGFLAMLYAVLHEQQIPARLQQSGDGERRLTNLLHLADLLQQASLALPGEVAVVRFLAGKLREPNAGEDAAQMRLETDAGLVKVVTMHKSKGLQYPIVFVPFAYDFRPATKRDAEPDDEVRIAEDIRLLYVAFTRAERALFVGAATRNQDFAKDVEKGPKSALSRLLGRRLPDDLSARLACWTACTDIRVDALPPADDRRLTLPPAPPVIRAALQPRRQHESRWRSTSFSALTRGLSGEGGHALPVPGNATDDRYGDAQLDNPQPDAQVAPDVEPAPGFAALPAGAKYGDLLHGLLEGQLAAGWPILRHPTDPAWLGQLRRRGELLGLDDAQQALLGDWITAIARCPLGLEPVAPASTAVSLATLPPERTWAEMGFVITTRGVDAASIDCQVQQQVLPGRPRDGLAPLALEGLLTGFLDLVFEHDGRYYVLDYKSNRLDRYTPEALADAILQHRYDLQYTLYLVALHRLLKVRLPGYNYDSHMGGAIYLFARGIGSSGDGIYRDRPPRALIEALDAAFREPVS